MAMGMRMRRSSLFEFMHGCLCRGVLLVQRAHTRMQAIPLGVAMRARATFRGRGSIGLVQSASFKLTRYTGTDQRD